MWSSGSSTLMPAICIIWLPGLYPTSPGYWLRMTARAMAMISGGSLRANAASATSWRMFG